MTIEEIIEKNFSSAFYNSNNFEEIYNFVENCDSKLTLKKLGIETSDISSYIRGEKSPQYVVKCEDNTVTYLYDFDRFEEGLASHISRNVSELSLPGTFLKNNLEFLKELPNLKSININNYGSLSLEELNFLSEQTTVENVEIGFFPFDSENDPKYIKIEKDDKTYGFYGDIKLTQSELPSLNPDFDLLIPSIKLGNGRNINVTTSELTIQKLEKIFNSFDEDLHTWDKLIEVDCDNTKYSFNIIDGIVNINIEDSNVDIANDLYDFFNKRGLKVESIIINLSINYKEPFNYIDRDYSKLDKLNEKVSLSVREKYMNMSNWEDFRSLVESMKWYRNIINDYPLSPVEKLAFAYDILKTFEYNESSVSTDESRNPTKIIKTGHIVCAGYTNMLEEIFRELDPNINIGEFGVTCYEDDDKTLLGYHSRSMAYVNDEKYGIKGIYALDPTWDSVKQQGNKHIDKDYTALDLYRYFMIPFSDYKTVFEHDSDITFFQGDLSYLNKELNDKSIDRAIVTVSNSSGTSKEGTLPQEMRDKEIFNYDFRNMFEGKSEIEMLNMFKAKRIPKEQLMEIIRNVRQAEGYSAKLVDAEMEKVSRIYDKYNTPLDSLTGKIL